jgi:uncharacterized protein YjiS (DUF1127 family)
MATISSPLTVARRRGNRRRKVAATLLRLAGSPVMLLLHWQARARERRFLRCMDDRALRDIGLSRADVERESSKPFWWS